jgi:hypothetical protein
VLFPELLGTSEPAPPAHPRGSSLLRMVARIVLWSLIAVGALPLDFRPTQQVTGNGRKLILKDRTIAGLQTWLIQAGLTTPEDITT